MLELKNLLVNEVILTVADHINVHCEEGKVYTVIEAKRYRENPPC